MITNDDDGMIRAALQHVGIIQHFDFAVKAQVERGELVRILQPGSQPFPGFYLYIPPVSTCLPRSGRCWTFWSRSAQAAGPRAFSFYCLRCSATCLAVTLPCLSPKWPTTKLATAATSSSE